jgi:hypothetical protein
LVAGVYVKTLERESAIEKLERHATTRIAHPGASPTAKPGVAGGGSRQSRSSASEQMVRSAASAVGRELGRQIIPGVLVGIFGGHKR